MKVSVNLDIFLLALSAALSLSMIAFLVLKGKKTLLLGSFICVQILVFIWSTGEILRGIVLKHWIWRLFLYYEYAAVCFIGAGWLVFCLLFTREKERHSGKRRFAVLFVPPVIFYLLLLTNGYHRLFFTVFDNNDLAFGPVFWLHTAVSYAYCLAGIVLVVKYSLKQYEIIKKQSVMIVTAVLIPFFTNVLLLTDYVNPGFDITPVSLSASLLLFLAAALKYRFLSIIPIALRNVFDSMRDAAVVVDSFNRIMGFNKAFEDEFHKYAEIKKDGDINCFVDSLKKSARKDDETKKILESIQSVAEEKTTGELNVLEPEDKCYLVGVQPITDGRSCILGRIITFSDISAYKELLHELNEKNFELSVMNQELKDYARAVEELAVIKERNRFAMDMHDSIGHTLTLLLKLHEACQISCRNNDGEKTEELLAEAVKVTREGLSELKRSVLGLSPTKLEKLDIAESLKVLASEFRMSGMNVDLMVEGKNMIDSSAHSTAVYRICQESLTNSLRHGKATEASILLRMSDNEIDLYIVDNGLGCGDIKKGQGLKGMEERVESLGGTIAYGSGGESGFMIHARLPVAEVS